MTKMKEEIKMVRRKHVRFLIAYLVMAIFLIPVANAWAMFLPSDQLTSLAPNEISRIQAALESKVVAQRLSDLGLTADEVSSRLSRLSDVERHDLATQIDTLYAGGDAVSGIVGLLVVAILVVVLLQMTGHKVIITK